MALVSLTKARALNNDFLANKRASISARLLFSPERKTKAYRELENSGRKYPVPHSASNPNVSLRIGCHYNSGASIKAILAADSAGKFTKRDVFISGMLAMLNRISIKTKQTPLMALRAKLDGAVRNAWDISPNDMAKAEQSMAADHGFAVAFAGASLYMQPE
jgi:hypothetical protein